MGIKERVLGPSKIPFIQQVCADTMPGYRGISESSLKVMQERCEGGMETPKGPRVEWEKAPREGDM